MEFITTDWKNIISNFNPPNSLSYRDFYYQQPNSILFPQYKDIFKCFNYFNISQTKVVILGQDPYYNLDQATGLCFQVKNGTKKPPSLKNIEKLLGSPCDFDYLASQGVLLLNSSLTVPLGQPNSHQKYWNSFTKFIISYINSNCKNVIFIIWGNSALNFTSLINPLLHQVHISSHPSPLSCNKKLKHHPSFFESNIFKKINTVQWIPPL